MSDSYLYDIGCDEGRNRNDWRSHLKVHLNEMMVGADESRRADIRRFGDEILRDGLRSLTEGTSWSFLVEDELGELGRLLVLCRAFDNMRFVTFAGHMLDENSVVHVPLKVSDFDLLGDCVHDEIGRRIVEMMKDLDLR